MQITGARGALLGAAIFVAGMGAAYFYFQRGGGSYDECMLTEMRGQPQSMGFTVNRVCARRYATEVDVLPSISKRDWWEVGPGGPVTVSVTTDDYLITRGEFAFSPKDCKESKDEDFGPPQSGMMNNGETNLGVIDPPPVCMRTISLKGRYK
jgi:hypothetical protein